MLIKKSGGNSPNPAFAKVNPMPQLMGTDSARPISLLVSHQGSGNLHSLVQANALLIVPSEVKSLPIDTEVTVWVIDDQII